MKYIFLLIIVLVTGGDANAYNHRKCMRGTHSYSGVVGLSVSSSSFLSSTGDCAMIGTVEQKKQTFIAINIDQLKIEVSQGEGEYLSAFSNLSSCSAAGEEYLKSTLQLNYSSIFGPESSRSASEVYSRIQDLMLNDLVIRSECSPNA